MSYGVLMVALMSKHGECGFSIRFSIIVEDCCVHFFWSVLWDHAANTLANRNFTQHSLIRETTHIKSDTWDDAGVFIYSMLNHTKYCLLQGWTYGTTFRSSTFTYKTGHSDHGVICTLGNPVYLTRIKDCSLPWPFRTSEDDHFRSHWLSIQAHIAQ